MTFNVSVVLLCFKIESETDEDELLNQAPMIYSL